MLLGWMTEETLEIVKENQEAIGKMWLKQACDSEPSFSMTIKKW